MEDDFIELVRQKLTEFERRAGRLPSIPELSEDLGVHSRWLRLRLRRAIATIGSDDRMENAFKSSLRRVLMPSAATGGAWSSQKIKELMMEALGTTGRWAELRWFSNNDSRLFILAARCAITGAQPLWSMSEESHGVRRQMWQYPTGDTTLICSLVSASMGTDETEQSDNLRHLRPSIDPPE